MTIKLFITSFITPIDLKIYDSNGLLLKRKTITNYWSNVCVRLCRSSPYLVVSAQGFSQTKTKYVGLYTAKCQTANVLFDFNQNQNMQNIMLRDQTYGFLVPAAMLKFAN